MCLKEPGVQLVDNVRLSQEHTPTEKLTTIAADHFQEDTWYVGSGNRVFRSQNNGDGWEFLAEFGGEQAEKILKIRAHPERAGHLVLLTEAADNYPIHVSTDCGATWSNVWNPDFQVSDIAWTSHRDGTPYLLLATKNGLFEVFEGRPRIIPIDITKEEMPLYAVAVDIDPKGGSSVAVALRENGGTYLSREDGKSDTFKLIGGETEDTRVLAFHRRGSQLSLWSGATAIGQDSGTGCNLWELGEKKDSPTVGHTALKEGWDYGGCLGFVFAGTRVLAATHRGGIVHIDEPGETADPAWQKRPRDSGLPLPPQDAQLRDIASARGMLMAITANGIFRGQISGATVAECSVDRERITLPRTMLFCSGPHQVTVVTEDRPSFDDRTEEESP
jgi:hypothetical protein